MKQYFLFCVEIEAYSLVFGNTSLTLIHGFTHQGVWCLWILVIVKGRINWLNWRLHFLLFGHLLEVIKESPISCGNRVRIEPAPLIPLGAQSWCRLKSANVNRISHGHLWMNGVFKYRGLIDSSGLRWWDQVSEVLLLNTPVHLAELIPAEPGWLGGVPGVVLFGQAWLPRQDVGALTAI